MLDVKDQTDVGCVDQVEKIENSLATVGYGDLDSIERTKPGSYGEFS